MFGEHAAFIVPAYAISFVALSLTTAITIWIYHARLTEIQTLEEQKHKPRESER
ncbi:MAG: heme exporter protein CcmD [Pseudomonadota bacterium]